MPVVPGGYSEVIVGYVGPNLRRMSTTFGVKDGTATLADITTAVSNWLVGATGNHWQAFASQLYTATRIEVIRPTTFLGTAISVVGAATNDPLPPNVSAKVQKSSTLRGRANRGFMFIPGIAFESQQTGDGVVAGAVASAWSDLATALQTEILAVADDMVILHSSAGPTPTPITVLTGQRKLATQRRRLRTS